MSKYSTFLFSLLLLFSNFQCDDCNGKLHDQSSYTAAIVPLQDNYTIGDTILLGASFSSQIPLERSRTTHYNAGQLAWFAVQVFEVRPDNETIVDGIEDFDIFSTTGEIIPSPYLDRRLAKEITIVCDSDSCAFQIGIIPRKAGIYGLSLLDSNFGENECESLRFIGNDFGLEDNNFGICQQINTTQFRLLESGEGGVFYANPEKVGRFYFFRVE